MAADPPAGNGTPREPRLGCGAAIVADGRILLVQRLNAPEAGHWGLPGGKIDWLEAAEVATCREVREETGLVISDLRLLCLTELIDPESGEHWAAPIYQPGQVEGQPRLCEPEKHGGLGWFALTDPPPLLTRAAQSALAVLGSVDTAW